MKALIINAPDPRQKSSTFVQATLLGGTSLGNPLPVIATALMSLGAIVVIYFLYRKAALPRQRH